MQPLIGMLISRIVPVFLLFSSYVSEPAFPLSTPVDTAKLNYYIRTGNDYLKKYGFKPEMVKTYIDSANSICKKEGLTLPSQLHFLSARLSFANGDFSKAEEEIILAGSAAQNEKDNRTMAKILLFKGNYYLRTGFFRESTDAYSKSIEIAKRDKINGIIQLGFDGIANVMNAAGDIKGYRKNLKFEIDAASSEKDTLGIETGLLKLGNSYVDTERDSHKGDSVLRKCLEISILRKDSYFSGFSSANIGWNFYQDKKFDSSLFYYEKSLKFSLPGKQDGISANSLGNIGTIYRDLGQYSRALKFYNNSLSLAKKINDWFGLSWVYHDMSDLYLGIKDTAKAYLNYVLYKQYNDSILLKKNNQGLADARIRYEADNHKKEIDLLSLRLRNNRLLNIGFAGFAILTICIAFLIIIGSKINGRRRLSEMNRRISEITQANLRQQMNPHFIFNTLNAIQYFMYQHDKLATNNYLTKFSNLIRKVLENSQHTSVSLQNELDALNLYLELECLRFKDKFDYTVSVEEEIDPILYKVPTMLIQPYVENSICHGLIPLDRKGLVKIDIKLAEGYLVCVIEDNGIGREAGMERKKAKGEEHNSLGIQITSSRLDLLNSLYGTTLKTFYTDLRNEKGEPEGTRVEIQIPIMT
jgi:tetratricopeptide (TPR) repeat protein